MSNQQLFSKARVRLYISASVSVFLLCWFAFVYSSWDVDSNYQIRYDFQISNASPERQQLQPEDYLTEIQGKLKQSEFHQALRLSEQLTDNYPNFQVGQWLYSELLSILNQKVQPADAGLNATLDKKESPIALADLYSEMSRRITARRMPPILQMIPEGLVHLSSNTRYFAVVDASLSRLFVFKNVSTEGLAPQLELLFDSYVSVGINGIVKQKEGDGRSPIGVYFTQKNLKNKRLPDLYGAGALTINYPNMLDVYFGRSGSGIWIHGSPSAQYSRAPQSSDGCIVLPNDSMRRLQELDNPRSIPILIQDKVNWVPENEAKSLPTSLLEQISNRYPQAWPKHISELNQQAIRSPVLNLIYWRDHEQMVALVDLLMPTGTRLRSYWILSGTMWNFVSESRI